MMTFTDGNEEGSSCPTESTETWEDVEISEDLTEEQAEAVRAVLAEHAAEFSGRPRRTNAAVHSIRTNDASPIRQRGYRIPQACKESFHQEIEKMKDMGVIEDADGEWVAPVVLVPKRDGSRITGIRVCIDFRKLNAVTEADAFPLPRIEDLLERLGQAKYMSKLDLTHGYWQIPLSEDTKSKTGFLGPDGLYQFTVMPFGMKTAPATFQRMIKRVLKGTEEFADSYLDDVIVLSNGFDAHLRHLREVLDHLKAANLVARPSKCVIGKAQIQYLGHVVGVGELCPLQAKVDSIQLFPQPETKKQVKSFLGLVGYYRRLVHNFSEKAAALSDLTQKRQPSKVKWSSQCEEAFEMLKRALMNEPVLQLPDFSKLFIVQVDASERGLGAILCQVGEDSQEHPVVYCSRKLLPREQVLATVEKECLPLVWAVELLKLYLYGREFVVETDHNSLVWLHRVKESNQKLLRWSLTLQQYAMTIRHKSGKSHTNADALSRV